MTKAIDVENFILALDKKNALEERKSKKVTFRGEYKKEAPKDPFDLEGLQKVLQTMSNEMVNIKKQVAETSSRKSYNPHKGDPSPNQNLKTEYQMLSHMWRKRKSQQLKNKVMTKR